MARDWASLERPGQTSTCCRRGKLCMKWNQKSNAVMISNIMTAWVTKRRDGVRKSEKASTECLVANFCGKKHSNNLAHGGYSNQKMRRKVAPPPRKCIFSVAKCSCHHTSPCSYHHWHVTKWTVQPQSSTKKISTTFWKLHKPQGLKIPW